MTEEPLATVRVRRMPKRMGFSPWGLELGI